MTSGDASRHLVVEWQWLPEPPPGLERPLPTTSFRDDPAFRGVAVAESERAAFRFSFTQLALGTPDLHFYRLIQLFNTPLLSLTTRDAGRSQFAFWRGAAPTFRDEFRSAHFWFFRDQTDRDLVVAEYAFDGGLVLYSEKKPAAELARRHAQIISRLG